MAETPPTRELQPALERARLRWLNAATVNAGGRWAAIPVVPVALLALALSLAGWRDFALLAALSALALCGVAAALLLTRQAFSRGKRSGAPDWSLQLDRELGLNDALVTLLDGAGPFAKVVQARVAANFDESRARKAAPRKHWGALLVALLLALMPLALWSPKPEQPSADEVAQGGAGENAATPGESAGSKGEGGGAGKGKKPAPGPKNSGESSSAEPGETQGAKPEPSGRASDSPGDPPPKDVNPEPSNGSGTQPKDGEVKGTKPPPSETPEKPVDSKDTPIVPDVGEGERRTKKTSKNVYDENGERVPGATANGSTWKKEAEDVIPRMKLTSRERKLLEEWFNKVGR
jgi:hypothetical protein